MSLLYSQRAELARLMNKKLRELGQDPHDTHPVNFVTALDALGVIDKQKARALIAAEIDYCCHERRGT